MAYIQLRGNCRDVADLMFEIQQEINQIRALESLHKEAKLLQDKLKWYWWENGTKILITSPTTTLSWLIKLPETQSLL